MSKEDVEKRIVERCKYINRCDAIPLILSMADIESTFIPTATNKSKIGLYQIDDIYSSDYCNNINTTDRKDVEKSTSAMIIYAIPNIIKRWETFKYKGENIYLTLRK